MLSDAAAIHRPISSLSAPLRAARSPCCAAAPSFLLAWVSREMKFRNLCLCRWGEGMSTTGQFIRVETNSYLLFIFNILHFVVSVEYSFDETSTCIQSHQMFVFLDGEPCGEYVFVL